MSMIKKSFNLIKLNADIMVIKVFLYSVQQFCGSCIQRVSKS